MERKCCLENQSKKAFSQKTSYVLMWLLVKQLLVSAKISTELCCSISRIAIANFTIQLFKKKIFNQGISKIE